MVLRNRMGSRLRLQRIGLRWCELMLQCSRQSSYWRLGCMRTCRVSDPLEEQKTLRERIDNRALTTVDPQHRGEMINSRYQFQQTLKIKKQKQLSHVDPFSW